MTKDLITNEIFRRVEPEGRTMGEYFEQMIQKEHGIDAFLRMDPGDFPRVLDF